jgi:hypothetical protein
MGSVPPAGPATSAGGSDDVGPGDEADDVQPDVSKATIATQMHTLDVTPRS